MRPSGDIRAGQGSQHDCGSYRSRGKSKSSCLLPGHLAGVQRLQPSSPHTASLAVVLVLGTVLAVPSTPQDMTACSYSLSGLEPDKLLASALLPLCIFAPLLVHRNIHLVFGSGSVFCVLVLPFLYYCCVWSPSGTLHQPSLSPPLPPC